MNIKVKVGKDSYYPYFYELSSENDIAIAEVFFTQSEYLKLKKTMKAFKEMQELIGTKLEELEGNDA